MSNFDDEETLAEQLCDVLENKHKVLTRRYDYTHQQRLTQAAATIHSWLSALDDGHWEKVSRMTMAEMANAYAEAAGGLRKFAVPVARLMTVEPCKD